MKEMKRRFDELYVALGDLSDDISCIIDYNFVNDKKIKKLIAESAASIWGIVIISLLSVIPVGFLSSIFKLPGDISGTLCSATLILTLLISCWISSKMTEKRVLKVGDKYLDAEFSRGEFIKVRKNIRRHGTDYYIVFRDDNGNKHSNEIPKEEYQRIKELVCEPSIYVLKYPKYRGSKYKYMAFDADKLVNKSSIRIY